MINEAKVRYEQAEKMQRFNDRLVPGERLGVLVELLSNELGSRRLMSARVHHFTLRIERPESVPEEVVGVVHLLDLDETLPVLAESCTSALGGFVATEELG